MCRDREDGTMGSDEFSAPVGLQLRDIVYRNRIYSHLSRHRRKETFDRY